MEGTPRGMITYYTRFVIDLRSRRVQWQARRPSRRHGSCAGGASTDRCGRWVPGEPPDPHLRSRLGRPTTSGNVEARHADRAHARPSPWQILRRTAHRFSPRECLDRLILNERQLRRILTRTWRTITGRGLTSLPHPTPLPPSVTSRIWSHPARPTAGGRGHAASYRFPSHFYEHDPRPAVLRTAGCSATTIAQPERGRSFRTLRDPDPAVIPFLHG